MTLLATFETFQHANNFCTVFREAAGNVVLCVTQVNAEQFTVHLVPN